MEGLEDRLGVDVDRRRETVACASTPSSISFALSWSARWATGFSIGASSGTPISKSIRSFTWISRSSFSSSSQAPSKLSRSPLTWVKRTVCSSWSIHSRSRQTSVAPLMIIAHSERRWIGVSHSSIRTETTFVITSG